jgi:hypothetical protein
MPRRQSLPLEEDRAWWLRICQSRTSLAPSLSLLVARRRHCTRRGRGQCLTVETLAPPATPSFASGLGSPFALQRAIPEASCKVEEKRTACTGIPAARNAPEVCKDLPPNWRACATLKGGRGECRVPDVPAARVQKSAHGSHREPPEHPAFPHAMVLTAYSALSPATNSSCHRHRRIKRLVRPVGLTKTSADLAPATGARTTRLCRTRPISIKRFCGMCTSGKTLVKMEAAPFVLASADRSQAKGPPCDALRVRRCRVHRIPPQRP